MLLEVGRGLGWVVLERHFAIVYTLYAYNKPGRPRNFPVRSKVLLEGIALVPLNVIVNCLIHEFCGFRHDFLQHLVERQISADAVVAIVDIDEHVSSP